MENAVQFIDQQILDGNYSGIHLNEEFLDIYDNAKPHEKCWTRCWNLHQRKQSWIYDYSKTQAFTREDDEWYNSFLAYGPIVAQKIISLLREHGGHPGKLMQIETRFAEKFPLENDFAQLGFFEL